MTKLLSRSDLTALVPLPAANAVEVAPGVFVLRAFGPAEAASIVSQAERTGPWLPAGINAGLDVDRSIRDAQVLYEELHAQQALVYRDRIETIAGALAATVAPGLRLSELQFVRYPPGGHYVDHRDSPTLEATPRRLSIVCYLNETFTGGELAFPELELALVPASGIIAAFAPTVLHRAEPVRSGTKYAVTAWYHASPARQP